MPTTSSSSLSLTTGGITLVGVLVSVGVTVAFGLNAEVWIRALVGVGTTVALAILVKLGTASGRGPLARTARWIIGSTDDAAGLDDPQTAREEVTQGPAFPTRPRDRARS